MAQNYKIIHLDPGKEPFLDRNGNQWVNVLFEGYASEQTKWVMRPESVGKYHVGDTVYGRLEEPEGKNYKRFYKEQKPDAPQGGGSSAASGGKPAYQPKDEHAIAKAVALKAAVDILSKEQLEVKTPGAVTGLADKFLAWLEGEQPKPSYGPDPMNSVHNENPLGDGEPDLPAGW
jgi:hypothetical protein